MNYLANGRSRRLNEQSKYVHLWCRQSSDNVLLRTIGDF